MLGIFPFIFEIVTIIFFLILVIKLFFEWYYRPTNLYAISGLIFGLILIGVTALFFIGIFAPQFVNFLFLKTLDPKEVASIKIGNVSWESDDDIEKIVAVLNRPIWHIPNHDSGGPFVEMTITLHSGSTFVFNVGRYNDKDAVLIGQVLTVNRSFQLIQYSYFAAFPTTLESVGYLLPPADVGYSTQLKDYLFLLLFIGFYVLALWPRNRQKNQGKSGLTRRARGRLDSHR